MADLAAWPFLPGFWVPCGAGSGLAASSALGLLVTTGYAPNTLSIFSLPSGGARLARVSTLRGRPPFRFDDPEHGASGQMAFAAPGAGAPLLVLTDAGSGAVHLIDVGARAHTGHVAPPGTISGPRGVGARGPRVAVSCWETRLRGDHVVHLYEAREAAWERLRAVCGGGAGGAAGQLRCPRGLRWTPDGAGVVVADSANGRVSLFRAADGAFVRHLAVGLSCPADVEKYQNGWLVACAGTNSVEFVGRGGFRGAPLGARHGGYSSRVREFKSPEALALIPGIGLVVREAGSCGRLQAFASGEARAMAAMSRARVAWMSAAVRAGRPA